jgi:putative endonuclease
MAQHNDTGKHGEGLAVVWLEQHGYQILHKNWRYKNWEIDVIAEKAGRLHIIEVKTLRSHRYGFPEDNMDAKKMQYLINAAEEFMEQDERWKQLQFDLLSISLLPHGTEYFLIEDVYL